MVDSHTMIEGMRHVLKLARDDIEKIEVSEETSVTKMDNFSDTQVRKIISPRGEILYAVTNTFITNSREERDKFAKLLDIALGKGKVAFMKVGGG